MKMTNTKIKILHMNIRSIISTNKQLQLQDITNNLVPDIISLNETYLNPKINVSLNDYDIIRKDRCILNSNQIFKSGGGGTLCQKQTTR